MVDIRESLQHVPDNTYSLVYADPPWSYARQIGNGVLNKKDGEVQYATMSNADIVGLGEQVKRITRKNSALLLWATMPNLEVALETIKSWGYTYKTCFATWVKTTKAGDKPFFGVGYYTRSNAELCLLGVRGRIATYKNALDGEERFGNPNSMTSIVLDDVGDTLVEQPRQHSRKPDKVRENIVRFFGDVPRVEFFARESTVGWATLGNQSDKFDAQTTLANAKDNHKKRKKV